MWKLRSSIRVWLRGKPLDQVYIIRNGRIDLDFHTGLLYTSYDQVHRRLVVSEVRDTIL